MPEDRGAAKTSPLVPMTAFPCDWPALWSADGLDSKWAVREWRGGGYSGSAGYFAAGGDVRPPRSPARLRLSQPTSFRARRKAGTVPVCI